MKLFHGSSAIIEKPSFGIGKVGNDFGLGFYCTESEELAKEWSVRPMEDGFANAYNINIRGLNILNLNTAEFTVLNWMAILVTYRQFKSKTPIANAAVQYLKSRFSVNVEAYDLIVGYRADDSYFDFAEAFLNNTISIEQLASALRLGKLGEQVVVKSKDAFSRLRFAGYSPADHRAYYPHRKSRNDDAEREYAKLLGENDFRGLYLNTIISERISNDDARLPRNASV